MKKILLLCLLLMTLSVFADLAERMVEPESTVPITEEFVEPTRETTNHFVYGRDEAINYDVHIDAAVEYLLRTLSDVSEDLAGNGYGDNDRNDAGWQWKVLEEIQQHQDANSSDNTRSQGVYGAFLTYARTGDERLLTLLEDFCDYVITYSEYLDENIIITYDGEGNITGVSTDCAEPYDETDSSAVGAIYDIATILRYQNMPGVTPDIYKNAAREMVINYHYWCVYEKGREDIGDYIYQARGDAYNMLMPWDMEARVDALSKMYEAFPNDPIFDDDQFDPDERWDNWADYATTCVDYLYLDPLDKLPGVNDLLEPGTWTHHTGDKSYFMNGIGGIIYCYAQMGVEPYTSAMQAYIDWTLEYMVFETGNAAGWYRHNAGDTYTYWAGTQATAFVNKALGAADSEAYRDQINRAAYSLVSSQDLNTGGWYYEDDDELIYHNPPVAGERLYGLAYASGYNEKYVDGALGSDDNDGSNTAPYATIQKGIDNAAGGIVHVQAGTYNENLYIRQTCKIIGENGTVTLQPSSLPLSSDMIPVTDDYRYGVVVVRSTPDLTCGVILENLDIDCSLLTASDYNSLSGVLVGWANTELRNVNVNAATTDNGIDKAVYVFTSSSSPKEFSMTNCDISGTFNKGVYLNSSGLHPIVTDCSFTGVSGTSDYGIYNVYPDNGYFYNNSISDCATGIFLTGNTTDCQIIGNTVTTTGVTGYGLRTDDAISVAQIEFNTFAELATAISIGADAGTGNYAHYNNLNDCTTAIVNSSGVDFNADWNYFNESPDPTFVDVTINHYLSSPNDYISAPVIEINNDQATINWNAIQGAAGYEIYYDTNANGDYTQQLIAIDNGETTTYSYDLTANSLFYKIKTPTGLLSPASGYVNYAHTYNSETTNQLFLGYAFDMGYVMASDFIEGEIGTDTCSVISKWNNTIQAWQSAAYLAGLGWDGDFEMEVGQAYMLGFENDAEVYIYGSVQDNPEYNFVTTNTTNINSAMVPLNTAQTTAAGLGATIDNCQIISHWVQAEQGWATTTYISSIDLWVGDFDITVGMPVMIGVSANSTWAP